MRESTTILAICVFAAMLSYAWAKPYQAYRDDHCAVCGKHVRVAAHHIIPQNVCKKMGRLDLIDDPKNIATLCDPLIVRSSGCHWKYGHRGINWEYDNSGLLTVVLKYISETERK
jgi:hypothetical protein